jgi:hypothetical protein
MTNLWIRASIGLSLFAGLALLAGGCSQGDTKGDAAKDKGTSVAKSPDKKEVDSKHSGWWCDEHGVPEAECSMCSGKVAAEFKKKGDWCDKHDRAKSQCFICEPKLKEKYAAVYRAKLGKEPPPTEDEEKAKEGDKKGEKK